MMFLRIQMSEDASANTLAILSGMARMFHQTRGRNIPRVCVVSAPSSIRITDQMAPLSDDNWLTPHGVLHIVRAPNNTCEADEGFLFSWLPTLTERIVRSALRLVQELQEIG